jgi:cytochrome P450
VRQDLTPAGPPLPASLQTILASPPLDERFLGVCARRYGQTFRLHLYGYGPIVATSDLALIERLFVAGKDQSLESWAPGGSLRRVFGSNPFLQTEGERHKQYRRRLAEPFRRLASRESDNQLLADRFGDALDRALVGRPLELWGTLEPILFDSLLLTLGVADPDRRAPLRAAFRDYYALGFRPTLAEPRMYRLTRRGRLRRRFDQQERILVGLIEEELAGDPGGGIREELLSASRAWAEETGRDERVMAVEFVKGFVGGGYRTTAAGTVWTLLLLLHEPDALERTRQELARGNERFLLAVAREGLRLYPPHAIVPVRRLRDPLRIGSLQLPPGTVLAVLAALVHRDPRIYPDPDRFWPERYDVRKPPPHAWLPFGIGLRRCLGQHWALERICAITRVVVERGGLRPASPTLEAPSLKHDVRVPRAGGLIVKTRSAQKRPQPTGCPLSPEGGQAAAEGRASYSCPAHDARPPGSTAA